MVWKRIGRFAMGCLWLVLFLCALGAAEPQYDGYIVKLSEPLPPISTYSESGGVTALPYAENVYVVQEEALVETLVEEGLAVYAEPNYVLELLGDVPNDPAYAEQWTLAAVEYLSLYKAGYDGSGVTVAILDTGLDILHPDFADVRLSAYSKNFLGNGSHADAYDRDQVGHGTFVASQIAAVTDNGEGIAGVADGVELMILRCVSASTSKKFPYDKTAYDSGSGTVATVSSAIRYAADHGADVINISLGIAKKSTEMTAAVQYAYDRGVVIVSAVGNDGSSVTYYPAGDEHVIGVGSVSLAEETLSRSWFSQFNTSVDVVAPGGAVLGIHPYPIQTGVWYTDASDTYKSGSGTSSACPVVAALAAIVKQRAPALNSDGVAALLAVSAVDLDLAGYDTSYGYGLARADTLLSAIETPYPLQYLLSDTPSAPAALPAESAAAYRVDRTEPLVLPVPTRAGYAFEGWCMIADCSDSAVTRLPDGALGAVTEAEEGYTIAPLSLYAKWGAFGDVTGDGNSSLADVIRLLKHAGGTDTATVLAAADCNADGSVSVVDALVLLRHILNG